MESSANARILEVQNVYAELEEAYKDLPILDMWDNTAVCATSDPELWFSPISPEQRLAQKFCQNCPIIDQCLDYAMRAEHGLPQRSRFGVWGGTTPHQRYRMDKALTEKENLCHTKQEYLDLI